MTDFICEHPVPFNIVFSPMSVTEYLYNRIMVNCNEFIHITNFQVLDKPPLISQTSPAEIYTVKYTLINTEPKPGNVYSGRITSLDANNCVRVNVTHSVGGDNLPNSFSIFARNTTGEELNVTNEVIVVLQGVKRMDDKYNCVGLVRNKISE